MPELPNDLVPDSKIWANQFSILPSGQTYVSPGVERSFDFGPSVVNLYGGSTSYEIVANKTNACVGYLFGHPIGDQVDFDQRRIPVNVDPDVGADQFFLNLEKEMYALAGSWVFIASCGSNSRLYVDANACLPVVFSPQRRAIATSTGLILDDDEYRSAFDSDLYQSLGVSGDGWFPSGLTAHLGIERVLANHYLDLETMACTRHWPKEEISWAEDTADCGSRLASIVRQSVQHLISNGKDVICTLTGGNESRYALASLRDLSQSMSFLTLDLGLSGSDRDIYLAKSLAAKFGLSLTIVDGVAANGEEQVQWQYATGHCVGGTNQFFHPTLRAISNKDNLVGGLGGEVARGFCWRNSDTETTHITANDIINRLGLPLVPKLVAATDEWLKSVRQFNAHTQLDLAYIELRMGPWSFAQSCIQDTEIVHTQPLISRAAYELMLSLPPAWKRENRIFSQGIHDLWPELSAIPVNKFGDYRDVIAVLKKITDLKLVARVVRKRFR